MSEVTPRFTRRTPLGQLHNTTPIITEKKTLTYDENIKPTMMANISAPQSHEETQEESEYTQTLKNAIKEANDENEKLRDRISELEALLAAGQDEIEQKDKAILELADLLENNKTLPKTEEPTKKKVPTVTKSKRSPSPSNDK